MGERAAMTAPVEQENVYITKTILASEMVSSDSLGSIY